MKILVADDDLVSRMLVIRFLEKMGYEVTACENGTAALEILLGEKAPRIAILDWMMPGLDGPDVIRSVREQARTYPYLILLTNRTEAFDKVEGLASGADDYLVKPVHVGELHARVQVGERFLALQDKLDENSKSLIRLEREQKNISLANMAGGIAHQLNNKLQSVIGFLDLLRLEFREAGLLDPAQDSLLTQTRAAALEASDIGRNMLTYLSQSHGKPERLDLRNLCASVLRDLTPLFPVLGTFTMAEECPGIILANPNDIYQVFFQILKNAMEADHGAAPRISKSLHSAGDVFQPPPSYPHHLSFRNPGADTRYVKISVQNGGPAIPPANLGQVFDPFFTTKFTGRGLGLAVTTGILKQLGGGIRIGCPPEGGTRVELALPITETGEDSATAVPGPAGPRDPGSGPGLR